MRREASSAFETGAGPGVWVGVLGRVDDCLERMLSAPSDLLTPVANWPECVADLAGIGLPSGSAPPYGTAIGGLVSPFKYSPLVLPPVAGASLGLFLLLDQNHDLLLSGAAEDGAELVGNDVRFKLDGRARWSDMLPGMGLDGRLACVKFDVTGLAAGPETTRALEVEGCRFNCSSSISEFASAIARFERAILRDVSKEEWESRS